MAQDTVIERRRCDAVARGPSTTPEQRNPRVEAEQLRCPHCSTETLCPGPQELDTAIACAACGATAEFRVWHEAWCESRRPLLAAAFPHLDWRWPASVGSDRLGGHEDRRLHAI